MKMTRFLSTRLALEMTIFKGQLRNGDSLYVYKCCVD